MGQWSDANTKDSWWERHTGREYGFENHAARVRRLARDAGIHTDEVDVPSASRGRGLPTKDQIRAAERAERAQERAAQKEIKQLQSLLAKLERQLRAEQAILAKIEKTGNAGAVRRAQKVVDRKEKEVEEIGKQIGRRKR